MTPVRLRRTGFLLIAVGIIGLLSSGWALIASGDGPGGREWGPWSGVRGTATCSPPALPGQAVDVILSDMGAGMMGGRMMNVTASPSTVAVGDVSFRVWNQGTTIHEFVVLPLLTSEVGSRPIGVDGQVSETGSLGEASNACGPGAGEGIPPGSTSWLSLHLEPGRYELICNLPGHYARGMFTELDVS
jgi:uncharacterized cupredoxin-like copper-binding protein